MNLKLIDQINKKCQALKREDVILVAVSKERSIEEIREAYNSGLRHFAENRVPEFVAKKEALPKDIHWHMIGKIQSKKVNKVVGNFFLLQSVDSKELAEKISNKSLELNITTPILLEVNTSGEASKEGLSVEEWLESWEDVKNLPNIEILGLMTMAPLTNDHETIRLSFRKLRHLKEKLNLKHLSMGMSHDWEIALEEGATLLRIGTALFN